MRRVPKSVAVTVALAVLASVVGLNSAYAFMGVADTGDGVLAAILAQGSEALATAKETTSQISQVREFGQKAFKAAKDTYELGKHTAQLAQSTYAVASSMRDFSAQRFGKEFTQDLETAFPDIGYWRAESQHPFGLGQYNPAVADALKFCLADAVSSEFRDACTRLKGKSAQEQRQAMLALTFGVTDPTHRAAAQSREQLRSNALNDQISQTLRDIDASRQVFAKTAAKLADLRAECLKRTGAGGAAAKGKRTYGAFQQVADDYGRVERDFGGGATPAPAASAAVTQDAMDDKACADLRAQAQAIAVEMQGMEALMNASVASLTGIKIAYDKAVADEAVQRRDEERQAMTDDLHSTRARLNVGRARIATDGTNILDDRNPHHQ